MRRLAMLVCVLGAAACGAAPSAGPAWPKSAGTERIGDAADDGGESIAPRVPDEVVAIEEVDADVPVAPVAAPAAKAADPTAPAAATPVAPDPTAPVMLDFEEEIIIDATPQP